MRVRNKAKYRDQVKQDRDLMPLARGTLADPPREYVIIPPGCTIATKRIKGYSVVGLAKALGKSLMQIRKWLKLGYIPHPKYQVKNMAYKVYDKREADIIRKHLYRATKSGTSYITKYSMGFLKELSDEIDDYRRKKYGK